MVLELPSRCGDRPPCARRASAGVCQRRGHIGRNECGELDRPCESGDLDPRRVEPANRAIWIPAGSSQHRVYGPTKFHGVGLPATRNPLDMDVPAVVEVSPLLRELIIHYTEQPGGTEEPRRRQRLLTVLIDQLAASSQQPIRLPAPHDPRLIEACRAGRGEPVHNLRSGGPCSGVSLQCAHLGSIVPRRNADELRAMANSTTAVSRFAHAGRRSPGEYGGAPLRVEYGEYVRRRISPHLRAYSRRASAH